MDVGNEIQVEIWRLFKKERDISRSTRKQSFKEGIKECNDGTRHLKKGGKHLFQERLIRYQFILENVDMYPVEKMCKSMKVSKNAYYHWVKTKDVLFLKTPRMHLKERIKVIFEQSREIYGSYRIKKKLEREGLIYARSYIGLLMKELGLSSVLKRKFVITTDSNHQYLIADNKLNRDFHSNKLGEKWVSDITYIRVNDDWNYLTTIIDLADRKVVGWSLSEDMTTQNTVINAWVDARKTRNICNNLIFHSDRGVQYASNKMTKICNFNLKITQSMSRKGNCWDNAVAEIFFKTIKHEWLYRFKFTSYNQLYKSIEDYIYWYNTQRLHSSLGYLSPLEMEIKLRGIIKKVA